MASFLGLVFGSLGEHQQARQLLNGTRSTRLRRVLGDDQLTPTPSLSASGLAGEMRSLGEYQRARVLDEDTLARCRQRARRHHLITRLSAVNLAADRMLPSSLRRLRLVSPRTLLRWHARWSPTARPIRDDNQDAHPSPPASPERKA